MSKSHKKFHPKSYQINSKRNVSNSISKEMFIEKLETIDSDIKVKKGELLINNSSRNKKLSAAVVIVIISMSTILLISSIPGPKPNPPPGTQPLFDGFFKDLSVKPLISDGKLSFIYIGGEFCPYCAIERWALVMALSELGSFSNLQTITSSESNVPTYTFIGSSYTSSKVDFQPCEVLGNTYDPSTQHYDTLQSMTSFQNNFYSKYDKNGNIPFICIGGNIFRSGVPNSIDPSQFSGKNFNDVQSQITAKSGPLYNQIKTESDYLISLINMDLSNNSTIASSSGLVQFNQILLAKTCLD